MTELKPCPFCGGYASINKKCNYPETDGELMFYVKCQRCGVSGTWFRQKKKAIEAWNRRD